MDNLVTVDVSAVPRKPTGVGRYAIELLSAVAPLVREDMTIGTCVSSSNSQLFEGLGEPVHTFIESPGSRGLRLIWEQSVLPRRLNLASSRVHHGLHYTIPMTYRGATVVTVHDMTLITHPTWHQRSKALFFQRAIRYAANRADVIVVPSYDTERKLKDILSPKGEVVVVPHGVKVRSEPNVNESGRIKRTEPYLLFVGTIEPRKSVETLVRAFEEVAVKSDGLRLVVAGLPGWKADEAKTALERSRFRDRIDVLGFVGDDELVGLYKNAAVFVYPSLEEGFGLPVLEAMAYFVPIVTTKNSAMEEVAQGYASLVAGKDVEGLADAIVKELEAPESKRQDRMTIAKERLSIYTWERSARGHLAIYESLL